MSNGNGRDRETDPDLDTPGIEDDDADFHESLVKHISDSGICIVCDDDIRPKTEGKESIQRILLTGIPPKG